MQQEKESSKSTGIGSKRNKKGVRPWATPALTAKERPRPFKYTPTVGPTFEKWWGGGVKTYKNELCVLKGVSKSVKSLLVAYYNATDTAFLALLVKEPCSTTPAQKC